jgi:putative N6-adenine-specific DNA methylase
MSFSSSTINRAKMAPRSALCPNTSTGSRFFVSCAGALEELLVAELKELGLRGVEQGFRGVYLPKNMEAMYTVNYASRIATRVLWPLLIFPCPDRDALYKAVRSIDWSQYLDVLDTFSIDANVTPHPTIKNSHFAALVIKDAICDQQRDRFGKRSSIDLVHPNLQLNLFLHRGKATLYVDTSGQPLFKRGYRIAGGAAPLQESLAAAVLQVARYNPDEDILVDPFTGSGTILVEAAMIATRTAPGFYRKRWGFERLPEYVEENWKTCKKSFDDQRIPLAPGKIMGADRDASMVELARNHLETTGFSQTIDIMTRPIAKFRPPISPTLAIMNPPYGERIERETALYEEISQFLSGTSPRAAYFLVPAKLKTSIPCRRVFSCLNGGLEVDLLEHFPKLS